MRMNRLLLEVSKDTHDNDEVKYTKKNCFVFYSLLLLIFNCSPAISDRNVCYL